MFLISCVLRLLIDFFSGSHFTAEHREGYHHEHAKLGVAERGKELRRRLHLQGRQLRGGRREQPHPAQDNV